MDQAKKSRVAAKVGLSIPIQSCKSILKLQLNKSYSSLSSQAVVALAALIQCANTDIFEQATSNLQNIVEPHHMLSAFDQASKIGYRRQQCLVPGNYFYKLKRKEQKKKLERSNGYKYLPKGKSSTKEVLNLSQQEQTKEVKLPNSQEQQQTFVTMEEKQSRQDKTQKQVQDFKILQNTQSPTTVINAYMSQDDFKTPLKEQKVQKEQKLEELERLWERSAFTQTNLSLMKAPYEQLRSVEGVLFYSEENQEELVRRVAHSFS